MRGTIEQFIEDVKGLKVLVVGETIIDEFIPVSYEGQSMKSICPVFKLEGEVNRQRGGAAIIADHLKDFVASVDLISNTQGEIVKTRYVDVNDEKKHVEINKFDIDGFGPIKVNAKDYDVVIVADFGHGFCRQLEIDGPFHLMCQTNSNNFGFNRVSKWKQYQKKTICLDLREARLQMNKRFTKLTVEQVLELYNYELGTDLLYVTTGKAGALLCDGKNVFQQDSFPSKIVDTIGAGDAFYSFACLMPYTSLPEEKYLVIPSLAGSLSTTWICNEQAITKTKLLDYATEKLPSYIQ